MNKDKALDLALEAMERYQVKRQDFDRFADEITAIKQARSAPENVWLYWKVNDRCVVTGPFKTTSKEEAYGPDCIDATPLTVPAAQRQWVGLTDDEIQAIAFTAVSENWDWLRFARAIEANLKEKNT
jgi:hypothetical protein